MKGLFLIQGKRARYRRIVCMDMVMVAFLKWARQEWSDYLCRYFASRIGGIDRHYSILSCLHLAEGWAVYYWIAEGIFSKLNMNHRNDSPYRIDRWLGLRTLISYNWYCFGSILIVILMVASLSADTGHVLTGWIHSLLLLVLFADLAFRSPRIYFPAFLVGLILLASCFIYVAFLLCYSHVLFCR